MSYLPINKHDMQKCGWEQPDFVFVTGDAYVDHPSFGTSIVSRVLEAIGFKVCILSQPKWNNCDDLKRYGMPKLGFFINAGNIDSMVAHYTASKKKRSDDAYTPGGKAGKRPDRAVTIYSRLAREAYPDTPIIIGGLEASLRRFAHYDYWKNEIMPSILIDSTADLLIYGMGENQTIEIARRLSGGENISSLCDIKGTCYVANNIENLSGILLPSFDNVINSKEECAKSCKIEYDEHDAVRGKRLFQKHDERYVVQNKPMPALTTSELDWVYALPYERYYHPSYEKLGGVSAIREVEFSITHNRGCFGACNFCSIAYHQGRAISSRSEKSIINEAINLTNNEHFKGYIHDVGGPTANFRLPSCSNQIKNGLCKGKKCLAPLPCRKLIVNHEEYLGLLRNLRSLPKVKKVFIRSGIRFDYLNEEKDNSFFKELVQYHVSGQLKVAPEHCSAAVLDKMGKPYIESYKKFAAKFYKYTKQIGKEQYLVPYLMSSHPGSTLNDAIELALFLKHEKIRPEQVQDFYPTPGTISTCMYYTGIDPHTMQPIFVPRTMKEKELQRVLLQYFKPENKERVANALVSSGRSDLIGFDKKCLITPPSGYRAFTPKNKTDGAVKSKKNNRANIIKKNRWDGPTKRGK